MARRFTRVFSLIAMMLGYGAGLETYCAIGDEKKVVPPRFVDRGEYIEDSQTGLLWQKDGIKSGKMNFYEAAKYAEKLELADIKGWRVPTRKELAAIFPATEKPWVNTKYTKEKCCKGNHEWNSYWTSELDRRLLDYAYLYQWYDKGGANNCYASKNQAYVRCVHNRIPAPLDVATAKRVRQLIAELGADDFQARETASRELKKFGYRIETELHAAYKVEKELEARSRLRALIKAINP